MSPKNPIALWKNNCIYDLSNFTIIIPSVAVGNVGQLASDLLISSLKLEKKDSVYDRALIPVIGCDPYNLNSCSISTSCELYGNDHLKIAVLQVKAPLVQKYSQEFLKRLICSFRDKNVKEVVILGSSFAHENKEIMSSPFRYMCSELYQHKKSIKDYGWIKHDHLSVLGGGYASLLFEECQRQKVPVLLLFKYTSEGDNIPDAIQTVTMFNELYQVFSGDLKSKLIQPASWKLLFGKPAPIEIY